jgi:hypothetical protein
MPGAKRSSRRSLPEIASETHARVNADVEQDVMDVPGSDYANSAPSNLWGFAEMGVLFTERCAADRRTRALPSQCTARLKPARVLPALALFLAACTSSVPSIGGKSAVAPAPGTPYTPPPGVVPAEPDST